MDNIKDLLEIAKDLLEILVLILTARQLKGKKEAKKEVSPAAVKNPPPLLGCLYYTISTVSMKVKTIRILLIALIVLNIIDGDFASPSVLDLVKFALLAVCLMLSFRKGETNA